ncbi:hypothetical protein CHARACLAT_025489 [Characodon lateralis]|uniref:Uncharacterized protein n=1 Tax=Characodon lateralis TaxID=208331 RepID=A0ABU7EM70_9TELE|nr:hypothetical protein [Characodon lateralis]
MVGPEGDTCADTAVLDQKEGQLKEAPPWKTKQGVCQRSRKRARQSIRHHTSICSLSSCRQALSQPAATSRWCSTMCGGAKAFQGCLQAASQGWPSSAWEVSSSWEHMKRSAALCYSRASSEAVLRGLIWRGDAGRVSLEVSPQSAYCGPSVSSCSRAMRNTMSLVP